MLVDPFVERPFDFRFSTTASIIRSQSLSLGRSSSKFPTVTSDASSGAKKAAGFAFLRLRDRCARSDFALRGIEGSVPLRVPLVMVRAAGCREAMWVSRRWRGARQSAPPLCRHQEPRLFQSASCVLMVPFLEYADLSALQILWHWYIDRHVAIKRPKR